MTPAAGPTVIAFPGLPLRAAARSEEELRFRSLAGADDWDRLPQTVRSRFGKVVAGGRTAIYSGEVVECRMSRWGRLLALLARLIGGPLPVSLDVDTPATVSVSEDPAHRGQFWTRIYGRRRGFPQVIHSSKRFRGPTGLEEYVGCGFGIALKVAAEPSALHFVSDHYFLELPGIRLRLPRALEPGRLRVSHVECTMAGSLSC